MTNLVFPKEIKHSLNTSFVYKDASSISWKVNRFQKDTRLKNNTNKRICSDNVVILFLVFTSLYSHASCDRWRAFLAFHKHNVSYNTWVTRSYNASVLTWKWNKTFGFTMYCCTTYLSFIFFWSSEASDKTVVKSRKLCLVSLDTSSLQILQKVSIRNLSSDLQSLMFNP